MLVLLVFLTPCSAQSDLIPSDFAISDCKTDPFFKSKNKNLKLGIGSHKNQPERREKTKGKRRKEKMEKKQTKYIWKQTPLKIFESSKRRQ